MPTSLGIIQILVGPPPPPSWAGCWPTPHAMANTARATTRAIAPIPLDLCIGPDKFSPPFRYTWLAFTVIFVLQTRLIPPFLERIRSGIRPRGAVRPARRLARYSAP